MTLPSHAPVAGVLLAAGRSARMGRPKQLLPVAGVPLVRRAAQALAGGGHDTLLCVVPPGEVGEGIRAALRGLPFAFVVNPDPARGLASSFRVAVTALPAGLAGVNFALGDMPLLGAAQHAALIGAFRETGAPVVLAQYGAPGMDPVRAPPHLFRADLLAAVRDAPDADHGPRHLIRAHAAQALTLTFPAGLLLDVDTPEALAQAQALLREP
ncbi:NTP transferase domain-containing protein [Deinococcus sp. RIT780]|uniref:nucleotidyltransferase family protein n=1 Tax=Deinococcus sp. RIT780 TaxID=2870472 RepID=UPI001C891205|nr:nucleotidyltransferase family protein [Deinococcus sp. RIT780]MBX8463952.1 nucleotidyltransferase family protein [Deinococcus sp. RIT780]